MSRIIRIDENHGAGNVSEGIKKVAAATRRPVLGELGNKVIRNASHEIKVAEKETTTLKVTNLGLKNVKARVDTRWRKEEISAVAGSTIPKKHPTKSDSLKAAKGNEALKVSEENQSQRAVKVHVQLNNGNELKRVGPKREESQLSLRQLTKINQKTTTADKKCSGNGAASSLNEIEASLKTKHASTQHLDRLDTHSQQLLETIENIDENDAWNPMLVSEYASDIYRYLNKLESSSCYMLQENFLEGQAEITHKMRIILIDWINEVHNQFKLDIDTYHMTVSLIDRYLQKVKNIPKKKLQLVGVTAMFIASKYEELFPPEIQDFVFITDDTYQKYQILEMEKEMLKVLEFQMGKPLPTHFLRRFSKAAKASDLNHVLAKYLLELASVDYSTAHYKPSEIAAAALYVSLFLFPLNCSNGTKKDITTRIWSKTLEHYTQYSVQDLVPIVQRLAKVVKTVPEMAKKKVKAPWLKYSSAKLQGISTHHKLGGLEIDALTEGKLRF
ncbi:G2/mitotic-specific cyclin-B2 [Anopheles bellator]|uniref:G2/mitotic-specific cyclin-B2 n=1 Tax=Anopheles bellator TaxID=139047 RepID=UPI0026471E81|nr:G2/mitotic-specific cyclin-B2 [Anopheles bellator]